ncbi:hypothetical protein AAKU58_004397 [Oxalobacteraceae bacterium GrIS 1.18]
MRPYHDAEITDVSIDRLNSCGRIKVKAENGTASQIDLGGLIAFRCEDLSMQNVVSRVLQSLDGQFSTEALEYWVTWVTGLSDCGSWLNEQKKSEWLDSLINKKINLIVFEPSAGATIAAICRGVQIYGG